MPWKGACCYGPAGAPVPCWGGLAVVGWLSLLSWSVHDPSFTHASNTATRNWMGQPGAVLAD
ncbi:MAG: hypothetical protein HC869_14840, partial [Rhodospirillales bacterium]|nr:hypothetical protein [Rhodospirillales bacterium]